MIDNWSDHVWPIITLSASAEIILKVVVELKRLSTLQSNRARETPAVPYSAGAGFRQFIAKNPGEPVWDIEVRWSVFQVRPRTVIRLRSVILKVFTVTR